MLNSDILTVYGVVLCMLILLYREYVQPALIFLFAILVFYAKGIIDIDEIVAGFSNQQILLIFLLLIISDTIKKTAALDDFIQKLFNPKLTFKGFIFRMGLLVSGLSAWLNNTPVVAFTTPYVYDWAKKKGISPSKVMIPLSFAAILGGTATLIGTSTNLIVNGLATDAGLPGLELFDFYYIGIPLIVVGLLYLAFISYGILPKRKTFATEYLEKRKEYTVETYVSENSELKGKTVEEANLRNLKGLFLVEIVREEKVIAPVTPREVIRENDILIFAGDTETVADLVKTRKGLSLSLPPDCNIKQENIEVVEVVISSKSYLVGRKAKKANFRKKYDAAILAIQRDGERLSGKIGEIELKVGDLLLLIVGKEFHTKHEVDQDLYIVSKVKKFHFFDRRKRTVLFGGLITVLLLASFKVISLFIGLLSLFALLSLLNVLKLNDVKRSMDLNLFFILVLALAVGKAITNSGAGNHLANALISLLPQSPFYALIGIYLITNLITIFVTNAAAVAITFPIAVAVANQLGIADIKPFLLTIAFAGSAGFITPFAYQTNLMVYSAGNYKFKDFVKVGVPLTILYMAISLLIIGYVFGYL